MTNVPNRAYRLVQLFPSLGRVEARTALKTGKVSHRFASLTLCGTRMVASCCIDGLTDAEAVLAFPAFLTHAETLVRSGKNVHLPDIRRLLQLGIIAHLGKGTPSRLMNRQPKRDLLPLPAPADGPLLPLDEAPRRPVQLERPKGWGPREPAPAEFKSGLELGDRASKVVSDHAGQVNLTDRAVLEAVIKTQRRTDLNDEQRALTLEVLFSKASGNPLEQSPEALAAFAFTDAMDKLTKGSK